MSRRRKAVKRPTMPDPRHGSPLVSTLVNAIMLSGKKALAQRIVYGAIEKMAEKLEKGNPVELVLGALENIRPKIEVKSRRVGGATYQVPIEVSGFRATNLSLCWIIRYSHQRVGKSMSIKLANEIIDTANDIGNSIKKKEETHKMAEANKAFAHFRY